jgi:hypothetical protein
MERDATQGLSSPEMHPATTSVNQSTRHRLLSSLHTCPAYTISAPYWLCTQCGQPLAILLLELRVSCGRFSTTASSIRTKTTQTSDKRPFCSICKVTSRLYYCAYRYFLKRFLFVVTRRPDSHVSHVVISDKGDHAFIKCEPPGTLVLPED